MIDASVSVTVSPVNACFPVNISYSTHPNAQMSARRSTVLALACSGDMYAAVPSNTPCIVAMRLMVGDVEMSIEDGSPSSALAKPKSRTKMASPSVVLIEVYDDGKVAGSASGLRSRGGGRVC